MMVWLMKRPYKSNSVVALTLMLACHLQMGLSGPFKMIFLLFFAILGVTAMAGTLTVASSVVTTADAQKKGDAPIILIVNQAQILAQSKAGKSMASQLETYQNSIRSDLQGEKSKLESDIKSYQQNRDLWSQEERQKKEQELASRSQVGLPQMGKVMESAFVQTARKAENDILQEAAPIMEEIVKKRGATILLDRSAIMYAAEETNITQEVISKLDKKKKSVSVEQVSLSDLQRRAAEASKNSQQR